ncbi:MAG: NAD(P)H-dependent flavin oxidoreductase [Bacteroidales bacterium]
MRTLSDLPGIEHPVLMAPMFLVSDENMILAAHAAGITAAFPAANYRTPALLNQALSSLKSKTDKAFGVNIIVSRSNVDLDAQLHACVEQKVDFIITSLGKPDKVIEKCHKAGILVFCDVTDMIYAAKVVELGADALIAVNREAGGHPGKHHGLEFLDELIAKWDLPVIYAGGISNAAKYNNVMDRGAAGVSVGTLFLATKESPVSEEYKQAMVKYGGDDIVRTEKLSGAPLHVINTEYVKKTGTKSNFLTRFLYRHKGLRRYLKALAMKRGMKSLEKAAFGTSYKNVWVAGPAIEDIHDITTVEERVKSLTIQTKP